MTRSSQIIAIVAVGATVFASAANATDLSRLEYRKGTVTRIHQPAFAATSNTDFGPMCGEVVVLINGHPACLFDPKKAAAALPARR